MKLTVVNAEGKEVRKLDVDDSVFGIEPNVSVLHQAYLIQRNNQRAGTAHTKTRGEVQGSTRKIRRQKYTGRARAGSERSPTRVGGGTAFGPRVRDYSQDMPKKMRRLAIRSALSGKAADGQLVVIDQLAFEVPRTKEISRILGNVGINRSALIVTGEPDRQVLISARNLMKTKVLPARYLNVGDMMNHQGLLMTEEAVKIAEALWKTEIKKKAARNGAKTEPRRSRGAAKKEAAAEAPAAEAEAAEEAPKPARRTRIVKKDEAAAASTKAPAEAAEEAPKPARRTRVVKKGKAAAASTEAPAEAEATAEAPAEEKKPARRTRKPKAEDDAPKTKTSTKDEKPKRATRSRAKAAEGEAEAKPKATRKRTTKKTEEGEG